MNEETSKITEEQALAAGVQRKVSSGVPDFQGTPDPTYDGQTMCYMYSHNGWDWTTDWEEAYELLKGSK